MGGHNVLESQMKHKVNHLLLFFNLILLAISWIMALYAYARLPARIPLWVDFFGREPVFSQKSPVFLLYILAQTLIITAILVVPLIRRHREDQDKALPVQNLRREFILLALIFFQLLFIHIQRSIILMAHGVERGIRPFYFYSVIGIILLLIPLYRMRLKMLNRH